MKIVAIASQKGGAGKSTFAANLAALADAHGAPSLLIDTDAQGSLSVWHKLRQTKTPLLVAARANEIPAILEAVREHHIVEWVFIDGPPQNNSDIEAMMRAATLTVIPTRPAVFDLASVRATIAMARSMRRPFFVALNAAPPKRGIAESPVVSAARRAIKDMGAPVWHGVITQRSAYVQALEAGLSAAEFEPAGPAAREMQSLWRDVCDTARAVETVKRAG